MAILRVANQSQLEAALLKVKGGDTIALAAGNYTELKISSAAGKKFEFSEKITITSADPAKKAVIGELFMRSAANIEIKDVIFDHDGAQKAGTPAWLKGKPFWIEASSKITIDNVTFDGHLRNGYGVDFGLRVKTSDDVAITDSTFSKFHTGLDVTQSSDVTVSGNTFREINHDGMSFGGIQGALIADNDLRAFKAQFPNVLHKDGIQFRGGPEGMSNDIVIRGNHIESTDVRHGIYFGNEAFKEGDMTAYHKNLVVSDNVFKTAHTMALGVLNVDGVIVSGNTVIPNNVNGALFSMPVLSVSTLSKNVKIIDNDAPGVSPKHGADWIVSGNKTDGKKYFYWLGEYETTVKSKPVAPIKTPVESGPEAIDVSKSLRVEAKLVKGDTRFEAGDVDFGDGDTFVFSKFKADTFQSKYGKNAVWHWDDKGSVKIDSLVDIHEIDAMSSAVSTRVSGADLIVRVDQGGGDVATVVFDDLGKAFTAAYDPGLF